MRMGLVQAHSVRAYWERETQCKPEANSMARDWFRKLATLQTS